ncbi:MAG: RrF2 family transcriptional regulator [Candidatus Saelkia tenebricola]|nr:RrF2 family transcriptional regulator [Candidatus Saelkia tenebricola]
MKLSTRSRYGLRFMLDLALNCENGAVFLKDTAKREEISEKYLSQLVIPLKAVGLINSIRGAHGGYTLAKNPSEISLKNIIEILEGDLNLVACVKDTFSCDRVSVCTTRGVWAKLGDKIKELLDSFTLEDLVKEHKEKDLLTYNI